ncbi:MAG: hypothetical protein IJU96_02865, partial [Clostridia bacterium]|nr:hypothetical protein [Clostridia bacterium]
TLTVEPASLNDLLKVSGAEVTLSKTSGKYSAKVNDVLYTFTDVAVDDTVEIPSGAKLTVANADTYAGLKGTLTINAGGQLYIGTQPVFVKETVTNPTTANGTHLSKGAAVLDLSKSTVTFKAATTGTNATAAAEATVYGWPDDWNAEIESGAKVTLNSLLDNVTGKLTVEQGGSLYYNTTPLFIPTALENQSEGTVVSAGDITLVPDTKTVTFAKDVKATIYGWPADYTAIVQSGAEIDFASQDIAGATLTYINAEINGGASIKIGSGSSAYEILGTSTEPTNGNYLTVPTEAKVTLGGRTLTIAEGTVTIPDGKEWITAWNDGEDSVYNIAIAKDASLVVNGKLTVVTGSTIAQETSGEYGSIIVNAGGSFTYGDSTIISSTAPESPGALSGTYLSAGSVTITNGTLTFGDGEKTTTATVYGWPDTWNAVITEGASVTLTSMLSNVTGKLTVNAGGALSVANGNPIFLATATENQSEGTVLTTGSVEVDLSGKQVTFTSSSVATVYGWPDGFTAKFGSGASVTVNGQGAAGSYDSTKTYQWSGKEAGFSLKTTDLQ